MLADGHHRIEAIKKMYDIQVCQEIKKSKLALKVM